jgi:hypothetical protein
MLHQAQFIRVVYNVFLKTKLEINQEINKDHNTYFAPSKHIEWCTYSSEFGCISDLS